MIISCQKLLKNELLQCDTICIYSIHVFLNNIRSFVLKYVIQKHSQ